MVAICTCSCEVLRVGGVASVGTTLLGVIEEPPMVEKRVLIGHEGHG